MVRYDPDIIVQYAASLYAQARSIIVTSTLAGIVLGGGVMAGVGNALATLLRTDALPSALVAAAVGAVVGGMIGYSRGRARAFWYMLQAQEALCQVQIEANTRNAAYYAAGAAGQSAQGVGAWPEIR
jgi:hypothetical protein